MDGDTIAAIATSAGSAGIGIVRVSGPDAVAIADRIFIPAGGGSLSSSESHTVHYGFIVDGGERVDEAIAILMLSPRSYTREDVVELDCHGGPFVLRRVLNSALRHGARLADPGEFTKRAFLNGRIDLSQAESVMDVIASGSEFALKSSLRQLSGSVSALVSDLRKKILSEVSFLEAALDDPEHYSYDGHSSALESNIVDVAEKIRHVLDFGDRGRVFKDGISTVIIGKPNVGKSSLLNALLGFERAIVTDIPGTTRDSIEEQICLNGILLNIIDTAGIRDASDPIEKMGVGRSLAHLEQADLALLVLDSSKPLDEEDVSLLNRLRGRRAIVLLNKSDLPRAMEIDDLAPYLDVSPCGGESQRDDETSRDGESRRYGAMRRDDETLRDGESRRDGAMRRDDETSRDGESRHYDETSRNGKIPAIYVSAKDGFGLDALGDAIFSMFSRGFDLGAGEVCVTNLRQRQAFCDALSSLELVLDGIRNGMPEDLFSGDLMDAYAALGRIIGESVDDDLVDSIFQNFCVGK